MLVLITYDVNTETAQGRKRLRKVAKTCVNYGQRVQNSVFECSLTPSELCLVENELLKIIDEKKDSIRIYSIGNNYHNKIKHFGAKDTYVPDDTFIM